MKRLLLPAIAVATLALHANGGCRPTTLTSLVRIRTFDCSTESLQSLTVKIGDDVPIVFARDPLKGYFTAKLDRRIDASERIRIKPPEGLRDCCHAATEVPAGGDSRDCYVEYVVTCDKPAWGINVTSDAAVTFEYERDHPDEVDPSVFSCREAFKLKDGAVAGFGESDRVKLLLRRDEKSLVGFIVPLDVLQRNPQMALTRADLVKIIDDEAKQGAVNDSDNARVAIEARKKMLPDSVMVKKR
jgi:hypothetical protein